MDSKAKTFHDLILEVQRYNFCGKCGGCVSFCSADNLGALETGPDGMPRFANEEKCLHCGICYMICPNIYELDDDLKKKTMLRRYIWDRNVPQEFYLIKS